MNMERTRKQRVKCAKTMLEYEDKNGLFRGNKKALEAYVCFELCKDALMLCRKELNRLTYEKDNIEKKLKQLSELKMSSSDIYMQEHRREIIDNKIILDYQHLNFEYEKDKETFINLLYVHFKNCMYNKDWKRIIDLTELLKLDEPSRDMFTKDLSNALEGELQEKYKRARNSKLEKNNYIKLHEKVQFLLSL